MSLFWWPTVSFGNGHLWPNDDRICDPSFRTTREVADTSDVLWPCSRSTGGTPEIAPIQTVWWELPPESGGARSAWLIRGNTKDASGNPLGGCTVEAFTTTNGVLQASVQSDVAGAYCVLTNSNAAHFLVAYKAGSPDVAGTTSGAIYPE